MLTKAYFLLRGYPEGLKMVLAANNVMDSDYSPVNIIFWRFDPDGFTIGTVNEMREVRK